MNKIFKYTAIATVLLSLGSCTLIEPLDENLQGEDRLNNDPIFAEGLLLNGYEGMPNQYSFSDVATDDAVSNVVNNYRLMATGEWNAQNAFSSRWGQYEQILFVNNFLEVIENVSWKRDSVTNQLFRERMRGEAIALRGIRHFWILQEHGGKSTSGELLGIPYISEVLSFDADFNIPRLGFKETVARINTDLEEALEYLPMDWDGDLAKRPSRYENIDSERYQFVFGATQDGRVSGRIIKAIQAKMNILAASPAFLNGLGDNYQKAANILGDLLNDNGGVAGLDPEGLTNFYDFPNGTRAFPEVLWRENVYSSAWVEEANFPPSLNGNGGVNPTQNLVDAFPMLDGTPFSTSHPDYDAANPYTNRDPRLALYVLYNGNDLNGRIINTGVGGGSDEVDKVQGKSTRSGFYMKKLVAPDLVISNDGSTTTTEKMNIYLRYTDLYLLFAEAANELGGPDNIVDGMSARSIIGAIRARAGVGQDNGDSYLMGITSKEDMRNLIRNERRLELCFEGYRLYDLRRWGILNTIPNVKGAKYNGANYTLLNVEPRIYGDNANYGPIPQNEIVKFNKLEQNQGW
ncbi:RagB/SusD family nutrient uptake outer membrane protein [Cellulophaga sp. E16_2]|uniref:RagB/SusD family nutrient uptake outer membrane protein n=1 Tax=unclassified Cellulophaga TaxID=2634405 RepID=UPI0013FDD0B1|nr:MULTISPECIES: RagB/SusD family nutrient uptake outer membrane protein [unclassified Cellulophaga]MBO0592969.1 RagB/SusD family nutrient uptake outer membrane protein [Cellulophaga sp. E16_2]